MKKGGCLIIIFLLICIETFSSLDYENMCQHQFSQGCPVHDGASWNCAKVLTNCSSDWYHCVLNTTGQPFNVTHTCAPLSTCFKGTIPIYDERKKAISCKPCREGYYQPRDTWSDETPECLERHTCEEEGHKIECDAGTGSSNTQDVYCRCDARKGYILTNFENREKCVEWAHATCYFSPCPDGQERLLNYSCAPLCPLGQKRDDKDICIPISLFIQTTSSLNDSSTVSGETTPKTTTATTAPTSTSMPTAIDSNIPTIIASVMAIVVLIILGVLLILIFRRYLYKRCRRVMNHIRNRRQSQKALLCHFELCKKDTDADGAAENNSSKRARTKKGRKITHQTYNIKAEVVQLGDSSKVKMYKSSAQHPETSDDSSSNLSRQNSDSNLMKPWFSSDPIHHAGLNIDKGWRIYLSAKADSPLMPNSSQEYKNTHEHRSVVFIFMMHIIEHWDAHLSTVCTHMNTGVLSLSL
ncbi:hypothetical protein ACJMK2_037756 [Sinanodonta woodiana]|uniref:Uncharacterized protein n=1 Tax=Sinanodonta woodiana TaxID=1069815 RepID=A0ABD3WLE6_SINWO